MNTLVRTVGDATGDGAIEAPDVLPAGAMAGPWRVERELGRGGMGAVYAVVHDSIGKRAALKLVHRSVLTPTFNVERVLQEAKVVNAVDHPNIVDIFETGLLEDGRPYIVMERLEGQTLAARADQGHIRPEQVIAILLQVADALVAAHAAHVVHRDLKLDNVFLVAGPVSDTPAVKLLDWGIAKQIDSNVHFTVQGQLVGTPQYLAPEQARGAPVTAQTDVYSLGVMAYELFLDQLPFDAETAAEIMTMHLRATPPRPSVLWPQIPRALEDLLLAMLAKSPLQRPTMLEIIRRFTAIREDLERERRASIARRAPPVGPAGLALGSCPQSLVTLDGPPPAEPAHSLGWRYQPSKRWQFVAGAAALIASTLLFVMARGDRPEPIGAAIAAPHAAPHREATTPALAPARAPEPPQAHTVAAPPPDLSPPSSPAPTRRRAPATPRRDHGSLDPDGTIDPYP